MLSHKRPDFFIVGAPKCGTTALNHYLAAHPDIFMARKETHFFGADLRFGPQLQFYRCYPEEYWTAFAGRNGEARAGESSVWYLFSRKAAQEIKEFNPRARIIIMLRNPVAMLYSLYCQFVADGNEHLPTFREALAAEADRQAGRRLGRQTYFAQALVYRETARFPEQVRRYFDVFGRDRVHVIIYDDFSAETARIYRQALDFLGVAPAGFDRKFEVINGNANGNNSVRSPALRAILNDPFVRRTTVNLRAWLPRGIFMMIKNTGLRLNQLNFNDKQKKRQPLEPELRNSLAREFAPEIERLSDLLGRDLTYWSKPDRVALAADGTGVAEQNERVMTVSGLETA